LLTGALAREKFRAQLTETRSAFNFIGPYRRSLTVPSMIDSRGANQIAQTTGAAAADMETNSLRAPAPKLFSGFLRCVWRHAGLPCAINLFDIER
jgi:hypothetical protein